ncbi:MAG: hypothetical protein ACO1N7_13200 [Sphingobacteriaceae bacterium]
MNILITAAATAQAYQLQRLLGNTDIVFLGDFVELPQVMLKDKKLIKIPAGDSSSFAHLLLTICLDQQIEKVYPLRKAEILALSEARQLFDEYGIKIMVPDKTQLQGLFNTGIKGKIIVKDDPALENLPDRGVFVQDESSLDFQLFTVD